MDGFLHAPSATLDEELETTNLLKDSVKAFKAKKPKKALEIVDGVLKKNPRTANAHFLKAVYQEGLRRPVEAKHHYDQAIELDKERTFYRQQRGQFYLRQKNFADCEKDFNESLRMKNYYPWVGLYFRGLCQNEAGKVDAARASFEKITEVDPLETIGEREIFQIEAKKNNFATLEARSNLALQRMPGSAALWGWRLAVLLKNKKQKEAAHVLAVLQGPLSEGRPKSDFIAWLKPVFPEGFETPTPVALDDEAYRKACRDFHPAYCYVRGQQLVEKGSAESIPFLQEACDKGLAFACSDLAFAVSRIQKDKIAALKWAGKACEQKDPVGCFNAACYECVGKSNSDGALAFLNKARALNLDLRRRLLSDSDLECFRKRKDFDSLYQTLTSAKDFSALAN